MNRFMTTSRNLFPTLYSVHCCISPYLMFIFDTDVHSGINLQEPVFSMRAMSHSGYSSSSVLPGVSLSAGSRHIFCSSGVTSLSESFLDSINRMDIWNTQGSALRLLCVTTSWCTQWCKQADSR